MWVLLDRALNGLLQPRRLRPRLAQQKPLKTLPLKRLHREQTTNILTIRSYPHRNGLKPDRLRRQRDRHILHQHPWGYQTL